MAALSAAVGVAVVLAAAFVVAVVMPENSFVDLSNDGVAGFWQGVLNQACGMTLAMFAVDSGSFFFPVSSSFRIGPLLFVAFPLGGCALGAYLVASRGIRLPARLRLRCGIATAVPFALAMLLLSILAGTTGSGGGFAPSEESVFLHSLLWGALGGALGAALALRRDGIDLGLPDWARWGVGFTRATLMPLALALAIAAAIGSAVWIVHSVRDGSGTRLGRSLPTALADDLFFAGDLGLRYVALGAGAQLRPFDERVVVLGRADETGTAELVDQAGVPLLPIPLSSTHYATLLADDDTGFGITIFDYAGPMPAWLYAPLLLVLMLVPTLLALAAGFRAARVLEPASALLAAAWGAAVGPIWALAMAGLALLSQDLLFGHLVGASLAIPLVAGAGLGALGGCIAFERRRAEPASAGWA